MRSGQNVGLLLLCVIAAGCTATRVKPISADNRIAHLCIQENPLVRVGDFVTTVRDGFESHGITTQLFSGQLPAGCEYSATYTARQSWDVVTYLSQAEIEILRDGRPIASVNYRLKGRGGFALSKYASTRSKILPLVDRLLAQTERSDPSASSVDVTPAPSRAVRSVPSGEVSARLKALKDVYDQGLITQDEYDSKRKALLNEL